MLKTRLIVLFFISFNVLSLIHITRSWSQVYDDQVDFQTWTDVTLSHFINKNLSIGGDAGLRGIVSSKGWNLLYIRPTVNYTFPQIVRVSGGIGSFNTFHKSITNSYEVRFFQDANISWPDIGWINFSQRFRFEERFFFYEKNLANDFNVRGRYLIGASTTNFKLIGTKKAYYLEGMWEAFVPFGERVVELFANSQRWYAALGYRSSDRFRLELLYIWEQSKEYAVEKFETSENILRIRFYYTLTLPEK